MAWHRVSGGVRALGSGIRPSGRGLRHLTLRHSRSTNTRFVRSIKDECLNRMIFFGQESLRRAIGSLWLTTTKSEIIRGWREQADPWGTWRSRE